MAIDPFWCRGLFPYYWTMIWVVAWPSASLIATILIAMFWCRVVYYPGKKMELFDQTWILVLYIMICVVVWSAEFIPSALRGEEQKEREKNLLRNFFSSVTAPFLDEIFFFTLIGKCAFI